MSIRFSFTNLLANAAVQANGSVDSAYPAANARSPERPFRPFKSLRADIDHDLRFDLGVATVLDIVALLHPNITNAEVEGYDDIVGLTGKVYDSGALTIGRSPNGRYHHGHQTGGTFNQQGLRIYIPTQALTAPGADYATDGGYENWTGGVPDSWTVAGAGATATQLTTFGQFRSGLSAALLTRSGADCSLTQDAATLTEVAAWWQGRRVVLSASVYATVASRVRLVINDGVGSSTSSFHTGGSGWETLTVSRTMDASATQAVIGLEIVTGDTTARIDDLTFRVSHFSVGGIWGGALVTPPGDVMIGTRERAEEAVEDARPSHGGWAQRLKMGDPKMRVLIRRIAESESALASWREIDRQWEQVDYALVSLRDAFPAETFVMRRVAASEWSHGRVMESDLELEEVVR